MMATLVGLASSGDQQRNRTGPVQSTGAVRGAHEQTFARDGLRGDRHRGIAEIEAVELGSSPLSKQKPCVFRPCTGCRSKRLEVGKGLHGFSAVGQCTGNGCRGSQYIDHHRCFGLNISGHVSRHMEIGELQGHAVQRRATQY